MPLLLTGWVSECLTGSQEGNVQRCSSVILYLGLSLALCFYFISWDGYQPTRSVCWKRNLSLPMAIGIVTSLFEEQGSLHGSSLDFGSSLWSVHGSPPADGRELLPEVSLFLRRQKQPDWSHIRLSELPGSLKELIVAPHYLKWVRGVSRPFIKIIEVGAGIYTVCFEEAIESIAACDTTEKALKVFPAYALLMSRIWSSRDSALGANRQDLKWNQAFHFAASVPSDVWGSWELLCTAQLGSAWFSPLSVVRVAAGLICASWDTFAHWLMLEGVANLGVFKLQSCTQRC